MVLPHFDKAFLKHLPGILADTIRDTVDDTEHDIMLIGALTAISTAMPYVTGMMMGDIYYAPFYTLLIGPSGSGKGCINRIYKLIEPWHQRVYDNSQREVKEYLKKKEECELYRAQQRSSRAKNPVGPAPEEPQPVMQKQLHLCGYISMARMLELLDVNSPYASLLFETELESVSNTMSQDFGNYGAVLNEAFHHEHVGGLTKNCGSTLVARPQIGLLGTGTPDMFLQLVPSTANGFYSRLLIYRILGKAKYHPLTAADSKSENATYFSNIGLRVLDAAVFLESSPTFVSFTDRQRKKLNRFFEREYYNVRVFGNEDIASVVLRHRLIIFRICMVLTALRKAEAKLNQRRMEVSDTDFEIAFHLGSHCLRHSMLVSTTMKHSESEKHFKLPTAQIELFAALPNEFTTKQAEQEGNVRGISRSTVYRMLKLTKKYGFLTSSSAGYYEKTYLGKNVASTDEDW